MASSMSTWTLLDVEQPLSLASTNSSSRTRAGFVSDDNPRSVDGSTKEAAMAPSTLGLLMLTFNCAKKLVNVDVLANHVHTAFTNNATTLPDVVVFALQEVAPLSSAFISSRYLEEYFARFNDAVNLAARQYESNGTPREEPLVSVAQTVSGPEPPSPQRRSYTLVAAHNVGYTAILLFARDPDRIRNLKHAEVGFGTAEMGNKGAVGIRALYDVDGTGARCTEVTFVAAHLAAMEWNLARRNANWAAIVRGLTFGDPEVILNDLRGPEGAREPAQPAENNDQGTEGHRLLHDVHDEQHVQVQRAMHDISVFKPSSHLFLAGDLNYRISTSSPPPDAVFPSLDPSSPNYYPAFLPLDQLTRERRAGRTMHGLSEHQVSFPPTYKYDVQPKLSVVPDQDETEVPWKFAKHRYPSWTDRVLYLDLPPWVKSRGDHPSMNVIAYDALPLLRSSDHRPVYLRVEVPLIPPHDLSPPASTEHTADGETLKDPRVRLPIEVDPEAWSRRRVARQWELAVGWGAFLGSTKEGAWIWATLLAGGVAAWWLYKTW
ncbi:Endonuclease/exonuclease/phosphatase, partial [Metarhizium brunneum ARSEF 3297]